MTNRSSRQASGANTNGNGISDSDSSNKRTRTHLNKSKTTNNRDEDEDDSDEDVFELAPLSKFKEHQHVWCLYAPDGTYRECEVVAAKLVKSDGNPRYRYYIHWEDFNRRMDLWLEEPLLFGSHPVDPDAHFKNQSADASNGGVSADDTASTQKGKASKNQNKKTNKKKKKKKDDVVEFVEEEYGGGMDEASIREHEEVTKVKNVNEIVLGRHVIPTWYFSPIPKELYPDGSLDRLYISEFTLNMYRFPEELERHYKTCTIRHPPGDEIYRDEQAKVSMFEVDGVKAKIYCQNLCYLAKFFLDHKTLHYDVDPFLFYVLCEFDDRGYHIVGYYSKEKYSEPGYNLACILTLPSYQRMGYGKFLISFSYELSKKEKKVGSPEKPLSDLGQISYRSYWSRALLQVLVSVGDDVKAMSVMDLTKRTSIKTEDVMATLTHLGVLQYVGGKFVMVIPRKRLVEMLEDIRIRGPEVNPEFLHWAPLKVDVKRDKWAISSKRKESSADTGGTNKVKN